MRYLSPEERRNNKEVEEYLSGFVSQSIKHNFPLRTLEKYSQNKNSNILDAGSASGAFLKQLSDAGYQNLYGLDLSNYIPNNVQIKDFKAADFNTDKIPYPDNFFDAVTGWCVLAHLENPYHFIREVSRILKKGGIFIFTLPHIASNSERLNFYRKGEFIAYKPGNDHISIWTKSLMIKTTSKYFDLIGEEFLVKNKLFLGLKGRFRQWYAKINPAVAKKWGSKVAYILRKK